MDCQVNLQEGNTTDASHIILKPRRGLTFSSENEAYEFYNNYGGTVGFSIRKECVHKIKIMDGEVDNEVIQYRRFLCNKAGNRGVDKRDWTVRRPRSETRTGCPAKMCISRLPNGEYEVRDFVENHNHELHTAATRHSMRSQRSISDLQKFEIDLADDSGIRPKATFDYMGNQAGGSENLGYTIQDLKNYLRTKRQRSLAYGEAGCLSAYFENQVVLDPSFTYSYQYDIEEKVTNIFWADPRMLDDYALFGDVIIFDTTFCTNKENRPLGVFVGFNHHRGLTIFGACLLYDETAESFNWLFESFLKAHGQKKPKTIFTDQDAAMSKALAQVLPDTWHGLCTWHILQNGINHHGYLMRDKSSTFLKDFRRCMYEYQDAGEFEDAWKRLYYDDRITNKSWLDRIYKIKEKWAKCYMKHTFTLGVRSTQLGESLNSDLKDYLRPRMDLNQFFIHFEQVVKTKRDNELKAEFENKNTLPRLLGFKSFILAHAGKVYTPFMYNAFLEEYQWIGSLSVKESKEMEHESHYVVCLTNEEGEAIGRDFNVRFQKVGPLVACSCRHFETDGILCRHTLKILDRLDIKRIPETYILSRWTRVARSLVVEDIMRVPVIDDPRMGHSLRYRYICPRYVKLLNHACTSEKGFEYVKNAYDTLCSQIASIDIDDPSTEVPVQGVPEPKKVLELKTKEKHKGSSKRKQSWHQRGGKGNKGNTACTSQNSDQVQPTQTLSETPLHLSQPIVNHTTFTGLLLGQQSSQASSETPYPYGSWRDFFCHE